jgi:O-antigen ligase
MIGEIPLEPSVQESVRLGESLPASWKFVLRSPIDRGALILALCCVPTSIAVAEFFLAIAVVARIFLLVRGREHILLPRCFWFWLVWAAAEVVVWTLSPQPALGRAEIRHLLLLGALFLVMPAIGEAANCRVAWEGIFLTSSLSSLFLIADFIWRFFHYHREIHAGGEISLYLRSGGLLNHWMVYGTVEIMVIAGLLSWWQLYPERRRRWWPVVAIHGAAVVFSLTRTVWVTGLVLGGIHLMWRRTKWLLALPLLPICLYALAPTAVRMRVRDSFDLNYYSNSERLEMLRIGWKMVREHPLIGVGPGRVDHLYLKYLNPGDPVPAWHGHLHNNLAQIAAQFGVPVTLALLLFVGVMFHDLLKARRAAQDRDQRFVVQTAILALVGYILAGFFEYTYGHSLGLILLCFAVLPAVIPFSSKSSTPASGKW